MKKFICTSFVLVAALFALTQRATAAIVTEPFLPRPGDTVKVTIAGYCLSIERWEQRANRIIFYGFDSYAPIQTSCFDVYQVSITNVTGPFTQIEVWARAEAPPQQPDGYSLRDRRGVKVDVVSAQRDPPTAIRVTSGIAQALSSVAARSSYGALLVQDAAGQPVESARVSIDLVSLRGPTLRSYDQAIPRSTSNAGVAQFAATDAYYAAYQPGDYVTYTFTLTDTLSPKPAPAFAVVGIVSPQFAPYAFPVVEYQLISRSTIEPPLAAGFFLASDAGTMQTLDALLTSFLRTYGAFTGLTANVPGAVPVCRFFGDGRNGRALTHWYTADAAECAAKRADPNWIYEGTPFWTIPARADGYCPPSTRAVKRLLFVGDAKPVFASARYTQDLASINASLDASGSATGRPRWLDDGVAFCAPE
jgi:hypothetical protein